MIAFNLAAILVTSCLVALTAWQLHRREWKLDLIARIEARVRATPAPLPRAADWSSVSVARDEYRRVAVSGRWVPDRSTLVHAATELGGGHWVLTPMQLDDGTVVLINRGFISAEQRASTAWQKPEAGSQSVTGLLRISEPGGAFLRSNDPAADRWFSRDVAAIAKARHLPATAPFFVDAERSPNQVGPPIAGLTVIAFSNNHLVYALTWLVLALLAAGGTIFVNLDVMRTRKISHAFTPHPRGSSRRPSRRS